MFRVDTECRKNGEQVVFLIPQDTVTPTMTPPLKEYRIPPSLLPKSFLQEHRLGQFQDPTCKPPPITLRNATADEFDVYFKYIHEEGILALSELERQHSFSLIRSLGSGIGFHKNKLESELTSDQACNDYSHLLSCYALGSSLHDSVFRDAVLDKIVSMLRRPGGHQSRFIGLLTENGVKKILDEYGAKSPLFKLTAYAYARFASVHEIDVFAFSNYPGAFKSHILKQMASLRTTQHMDGVAAPDFVKMECNFHAHGPYDPCSLRRQQEAKKSDCKSRFTT
jgi:hypothetical protein